MSKITLTVSDLKSIERRVYQNGNNLNLTIENLPILICNLKLNLKKYRLSSTHLFMYQYTVTCINNLDKIIYEKGYITRHKRVFVRSTCLKL